MKTKSQNGNQTSELNEHQTDLESCWWSADCDVKVKNRKIKVSGMFENNLWFSILFFSENNEGQCDPSTKEISSRSNFEIRKCDWS